ncbi:deoxyribonuclease-1-like [Plectropomus leopardus]|uniref:deoxyribonuclease-1-like n=1 Tax=Plectropomus leopardus TaxID=160734 RepID=UPI001C4B9926|nr:deoxyribonuclease-1-like [Plectropomus leopardus]
MKIAAFNVKQLGWRKVNNPVVRKNLIKIVSRYSIVVMLEVVDQSGRAMIKFCNELNKHRMNRCNPFAMRCSESLGRGTYREKFVYFYREDDVTLIDSYQYREEEEEEEEAEEEVEEQEEEEDDDDYDQEDEDEEEEEEDDDDDDDDDDDQEEKEEEEEVDVLAREPFCVQFECHHTVLQHLVLIPVHTKPEDTEIELDALLDVVQDVRRRWRTNNIMILGDFNADGQYLSRRGMQRVQIRYPPYYWLIGDDEDTTTSDSNDHTYDRIVVYGGHMYNSVVPNSAKPFNFQRAYRLSRATTRAISDHYPVEVELQKK